MEEIIEEAQPATADLHVLVEQRGPIQINGLRADESNGWIAAKETMAVVFCR